MIRSSLLLLFLLLAGASVLLSETSRAHGGAYRGPGDTQPPGSGSGGSGGSQGTPTGPTSKNPSGSTSGSGGSGTVQGPNQGGQAGGPSGGTRRPSGPGIGPDESDWSQWWELNKDRYLELKSRLYSYDIAPGSAHFFLGGWPVSSIRDSLRPTESQIRDEVVPALLKALHTETHNEIVTGCLVALAKTGRTESEAMALELEKAFVPFLADSNQEIAETAALSLGILGHDHGATVLQELLLDTELARRELVKSGHVHYRTRAFAAYGLSIIGSRTSSADLRSEIVASLFQALRTDSSGTKDVRVACLVALGRTPVLNALPDPSADDRLEWKPEDSRVGEIEALRAYFESSQEDFLVRAHAPTSLVSLLEGLPPAVRGPLEATLGQSFLERVRGKVAEPREVVLGCIIALGLLGDSDADSIDERIRETLLDIDSFAPDPLSRRLACIALAQIASRPGDGAEPGKGRAAVETALREGLTGSTPERPWCALGIGVLGRADLDAKRSPSPELDAALLRALRESATPDELGACAIATGMIGIEDALPVLQEKLKEVSVADTRGYVVLAMGLIGRRDAMGQVQEVVQGSRYRPILLRQAAVSLGLMGDKSLVSELIGMIAEANGLATQAATASALGFIGDSRSIAPLLEMLSDDKQYTDTARGFAAVSLGLVADDSDLPWNATFANDINYRAVTPTLNDDQGAGLLNIL